MGVENTIRRQAIVERIKKYGPTFINNFFNRVPWPDDIRLSEMAILPGFNPDKPFRDFYPPDPDDWEGEGKHSAFFWSIIPRAYYELIDKALTEEVGLDKIRGIQSLLGQPDTHYPTMMNEACEPAYLKLVEMGFTSRDLSE